MTIVSTKMTGRKIDETGFWLNWFFWCYRKLQTKLKKQNGVLSGDRATIQLMVGPVYFVAGW